MAVVGGNVNHGTGSTNGASIGSVTIPRDTNMAGSDSCRGSGSCGSAKGLNSQFAAAVSAAINELRLNRWTVNPGNRGFVSKSQFEALVRNGNYFYSDDTVKRIFGWGFGLECSIRESSKTPSKSYQSILNSHGLGYAVGNGGTGYILPQRYSFNNDVKATVGGVDVASFANSSSSSGGSSGGDTSGDATAAEGAAEDASQQASVNSVAYYFANTFASIQQDANSELLRGNRALANDEPVFNYVKSAVQSSLRTFSSSPDGKFMAWYPDYWGLDDPVELELDDVELIDLTITQSDDEFYSHVYCSGVDMGGNSVETFLTQGVVSIESDVDARMSSWLEGEDVQMPNVSDSVSAILNELVYIPEGEEWKYTPKELYRRYGARPLNAGVAKTLIESPGDDSENPQYILPFMNALNEFMKHWANQYKCQLKITFMPDLFPGYRIRLKSYDLSMFVQSVSHSMSYTNGFTTDVTCICPTGSLVSGMVNPK